MANLITEAPIHIYNPATDEIDLFTPNFNTKEWGAYSGVVRLMMGMDFRQLKKVYDFAKDIK